MNTTNSIIPFAPKPAALRQSAVSAINSALSNGVGSGGFPVISIKGKVFHIARGDSRTLVTKPGEDDPAASLEVVIIAANANTSRVFYERGFEEGSVDKPTCYSNNGKSPEADAQSPQAKTCASCVHAAFGSKVSESGQKGFACANSRRLAVAPVGQLNDPMLIRVPGASLKSLAQYAKELDGHGYAFTEVVTKVGFDYSVAHPALVFRAVGILPVEAQQEVTMLATSDTVAQILGTIPTPADPAFSGAPASVAALPKKDAPTAVAALDAVVAAVESKPTKAKVKVEADKPSAVEALTDNIESMLADTDFDL